MCTKSGRHLIAATASKPFARHIVVSAQAVQPSVEASSETPSGTIVKHKNPPRQCYPKEVLKHRFMPYGSVSGLEGDIVEQETESMDVDTLEVPPAISPSSKKTAKEEPPSSPKEAKKVKGKKRKGDGEAPTAKKSKKAKTS